MYLITKKREMKYVLKKLRGTSYNAYCRNCGFSDHGETRACVDRAKRHAIKNNHNVEYYIENGRVVITNEANIKKQINGENKSRPQ